MRSQLVGSRDGLPLRAAFSGITVAALLLGMASSTRAVDQPIAGHRVKLMTTATGTRLVFVSKDPAYSALLCPVSCVTRGTAARIA